MRRAWHLWSLGHDGIRLMARWFLCSFWPWRQLKFPWDSRWWYRFITASSLWTWMSCAG